MREPNEAQFINPPIWSVQTGAVALVAAQPPKAVVSPRRVTIAVAPMVGARMGKRSRIKAVTVVRFTDAERAAARAAHKG